MVNLFRPCPGALLSVTTACKTYILTNSYAFGNMLLPNFYCPPKEIRALCILGKNTLLKYSYFHGCVCLLCKFSLVAVNKVLFCGAGSPVSSSRLSVCTGNSCSWPKPTGPRHWRTRSAISHSLFLLA